MEESGYLARAKASKAFDTKKYGQKHSVFGLLVLESDQDLDRTNVQGDFSVIGDEFVNYISTVATCRIIRKARQCGLFGKIILRRPDG